MLAIETQPAWICSSPDPPFFYSVWRDEKHWEKPINQYLQNTWRILMLRKPLQSITGIGIAQDKINVIEQLGRNFRISILSIEGDKQRHSCLCKKKGKSWSNMRNMTPLLVESVGRGRKGRRGERGWVLRKWSPGPTSCSLSASCPSHQAFFACVFSTMMGSTLL